MKVELSDIERANYLPAYGLVLFGLKRYPEAEPVLLETLRRFEALSLTSQHRYLVTLNALAKLCDATTRPTEAQGWRDRIAELERTIGRDPASSTSSAPSTRPG